MPNDHFENEAVHQPARNYTNGEVTIRWKPKLCWHSGKCFRGLPQVFNPMTRPWVNPEGATTQQILDQVNACPSHALTAMLNNQTSSQ